MSRVSIQGGVALVDGASCRQAATATASTTSKIGPVNERVTRLACAEAIPRGGYVALGGSAGGAGRLEESRRAHSGHVHRARASPSPLEAVQPA